MSDTLVAPQAAQPQATHNVPAALSSLVGRTREVAQVETALAGARLITLVGAGGAGKTRLAREIAARAADQGRYGGGVWWVELAPVAAGADVPAATAAVLGVNPSAGRGLVDAVAEALRGAAGAPPVGRTTLLVLDNCEHVIDAAAALADALLRAAPGLTVLATSREALAVEGEVAWPAPPLASPPAALAGASGAAAAIGGFEAVQLFVERARAASPGFALTDANAAAVAAVCARLDGLPLALELAAAALPAFGVEALAARLDDALAVLTRGRRTALPRHRTLRAVLDWSYQLLADDERALLRRLSVFRGPFTLDAVEAVCGASGGRADVVLALGRLVEHSLVDVREAEGEARYRLLETVRQYGAALMRNTPEAHEARSRHARWVAGLAAAAEPLLFSPARGRTVARVQRDVDEVRAALAWAAQLEDGRPAGAPMTAVRIAGALGWFWLSGVPWEEGRALLAATLAAADAEGVPDAERPLADRVALGTLFYPSVGLTYFAGDTDAMLALTTRELALWDTVDADVAAGDAAGRPVPPALRLAAARGRTLAHQLRGLAHAMRGEQAEAVRQLDRSLAVADAAGDAWLLAVMTMRRALVHLTVGNHAAADADYRAAIPRLRAVGERWFLSLTHEGMGANALATGDLATAAAEARQAVRALREERDEWFASRGLDTLAAVLAAASTAGGDPAGTDPGVARLGARLLGLTDALRRRCGAAVLGTDQQRQADAATALRTRLGDAAFAAAHAEGEALTLDDAFAIVDDDQAFTGLVAGPAAAGGVASRTAGDDLRPAAPVAPRPAPRIEHTLRLDVLGPLVMAHDGTPVPTGVLPAGKATELLLLLVARPAGVTRDQAGLALWPEASLAQVRNAFHVTLHHVRRALGGLGDADGDGGAAPWVVFADGRYRLLREAGPGRVLDCDLDAVVAAADVLRRAERAREPLAAAALADLAGALARGTRGTFGEGAAAGEWMAEVEDRARAAWADGTQLLARQHARAGRQAEAASMLEAFVGREPLREAAHRELMVLWTAVGERARALAHYDTLTAVLRRELNAEPARETRTLAEQIRQAR